MTSLIKEIKEKNIASIFSSAFSELDYSPQGTVFIKPNLCAREITRKSENTDPLFLRRLCEYLVSLKCYVYVGHRSNMRTKDIEFSFEYTAKISGLNELSNIKGITVVDLDKCETIKKTIDSIDFEIPKIVLNSDSYINLAKLKTHMQTSVSLSTKNQIGLLPMRQRLRAHSTGLDRHISYLASTIHPTINIIEGIYAMEGNGPHHGKDKKVNLALFGDNMVELDSLACYVMDIDFKSVEHLRIAKELGVGDFISYETANNFKRFQKPFIKPSPYEKKGICLYVYPSDACPGCLKALEEAGKKLKNKIVFKFLLRSFIFPTEIFAGHCKEMKKFKSAKSLGIGNCSKSFCSKNDIIHLAGCPMSSSEIASFLERNL